MNIKRFCPKGHDTSITGRTKQYHCRICKNGGLKIWRERNPFYVKRGIQNCGFRHAGILNSDGTPFTNLDYDRAYQVQQGRCAGCSRHQSELNRRLDADHDHKTGFFRFLLCANCNRALGYAKDSPTLLRKLAQMIEHVLEPKEKRI